MNTALKYWAFHAPQLRPRPIYILIDGSDCFIDVRSLCEALGISWRRWELLFKNRAISWRLEKCLDRNGKATLLLNAKLAMQVLGEIRPVLLDTYSGRAADLALRLRAHWREDFAEAADIEQQGLSDPRIRGLTAWPKRNRKVTAEVIRQLFDYWVAFGDLDRAAAEAGIGRSTAFSIRAGTYKNWDGKCQDVWQETFALRNAQEPVQMASRIAERDDSPVPVPQRVADSALAARSWPLEERPVA